jgi:hypothetical protein
MSVNQPYNQSPPQPPRHRYLLWAALVFLALLIICLVGMILVMSGGRLPDLGGADVTWTPQPDQSTATTAALSSPAMTCAFGRETGC